MNWRLILLLSLFGPVIGALLVLGVLPRGVERLAWLVATLFASAVIARQMPSRQFAHGAVVGFISGAVATLVQGVFSAAFAHNNPWVVDAFAEMPDGFNLQYFIMMLVPFIGVASAFAGGVLAHLAARVIKPPQEGNA